MALVNFSVKVTSRTTIPKASLTPVQSTAIGNKAITRLVNRVQRKNTGIYDEQMPPYSARPIYVALGKDRGRAVIKSGSITIKSLNALRKSGARIVSTKDASPKLLRKIKGIKNAVVNTGNALKFANRTAYKRFLGKSGLRDLTETGAMLDALVVISVSGNSAKVITIGYTDPIQARKAAGNMKWADWFGLSPNDERILTAAVEKMVGDNLNLTVIG